MTGSTPNPQTPAGTVLLLADGWSSLLATHADQRSPAPTASEQLALVLPAYLSRQRWFAAKGKAIERITVARRTLWQRWLLTQLDVDLRDGPTQTYWLPLALAWADDEGAGAETIAASDVLTRVCQGETQGVLYDALADPCFCRALLAAMGDGANVDAADGEDGGLEFASTAAFVRLVGDDLRSLPVRRASASSSNSTLLIGDRLFLKAYRRLSTGINPEVEMGRFLTDASPYAHIAPLAGTLTWRGRDATLTALAMLQACVASEGDAWSHTLAGLAALIDEAVDPDRPSAAGSRIDARHAAQRRRWATLGRRTGELHQALSKTTGDDAFDPEPISAAMLRQWTQQVSDEAAQTLAQLASDLPGLPAAQQPRARRLLAARQAVLEKIDALRPAQVDAQITRYHGDFHLGQVLVVGDDFVLIDFEGEPSRPLAQRRRKHSPLRDVAGLLRSLNYAANSALGEALAAGIAPAEIIEPVLADWEARARTSFLDGYRAAAGDSSAYAKDAQASARLLELFLLEKAFYELRYELGHRPDWVHVPLGGLLALLLTD